MDPYSTTPIAFWPSIAAAAIGVALIAWEARQMLRASRMHQSRWTTEE